MMVTVIIPNYNHARYLPQRIESVLNQSFQDTEVILMDDCSTDNSREIIANYAAIDSRIRVVLNEKNGGNTFKQWNKGVALAKGKYVWIAESDDYAELILLESLVTQLENNPSVGIAYCESTAVDEEGGFLYKIKEYYNNELRTKLWNTDFVMPGHKFLKEYMSFANVIPNASAVLIRKEVLDKVGPADTSMRLAGDWLYWNKLLNACDVAYIHNPFNHFRTHTANVRTKNLKNGVLLEETSQVMISLKNFYPDEPYNANAIKYFLDKWVREHRSGNIPFMKHFVIARNFSKVVNGYYFIVNKLLKFFLVGSVKKIIK